MFGNFIYTMEATARLVVINPDATVGSGAREVSGEVEINKSSV